MRRALQFHIPKILVLGQLGKEKLRRRVGVSDCAVFREKSAAVAEARVGT